jgi:hypothetical protein
LLRARRFQYFHTSQPRSAYRRFHTTPVFHERTEQTDHARAPGIASPVRILERGLKLRATHIVLVGVWASSAGFVMFAAMWMYLAVGFGVLIAFNVLVLAVVAVAARHIEPREELRPAQRARLITYVR